MGQLLPFGHGSSYHTFPYGTAIRTSPPAEQVGFQVTLNTRVEKNVVSKLDLKTLEGKTVSVKGAFTYDGSNAKDILVTPVLVTVG